MMCNDSYYNTALSYMNSFLDYTLYYKIYVQESYYFKILYDYVYPPSTIVHAKLYKDNDSVDITNEFTDIIEKNNFDHINWSDITNIYDQSSNKFHLDIKYMIEDNHYRIIYHYENDDEIRFPPYTKDEIKVYQENKGYKKTVLFAEVGDQDVTQLVKEYSGPLNDFYKDRDHHSIRIHAHLIKDDYGAYILVEDESIKITNSLAEDIEFTKEEVLKL